MSSWLARISPELVERLPIGARGHHLLLQPTLPPTPLLLPATDQALLQQWLSQRMMRQRWTTLLGQGSDAARAEDLLRRLLECGWCEVELHAEPGRLGQWEPFWVNWREVYQLRELIGLGSSTAREDIVQLWRGWQPQNPKLQTLADSLSQRVQSSTLERRLKIAQGRSSARPLASRTGAGWLIWALPWKPVAFRAILRTFSCLARWHFMPLVSHCCLPPCCKAA